ncbi:hypothetical protein F4677DRAFT_442838 [Hypoxylon crocopeplum]|nr:hypothetical protein F4677DRAFT_442838 [Hypoxylon crocopeplum]
MTETKEGIDKYFCLLYYSRMRFIDQLLPLLTASPLPGHVVSVLNSGREAAIVADDMALKDPRNQGLRTGFAHRVGVTNVFMEDQQYAREDNPPHLRGPRTSRRGRAR